MSADGGHIGPVPGSPAVGRIPGVDKIEGIAHRVGSVQTQLSSNDALLIGGQVDRAVGHRSELSPLKNDLVNSVGEPGTGHPVEHHIAHRLSVIHI